MKKFIYFILFTVIIISCSKKYSSLEMVLVENGSFLMGSETGSNNEKPVHKVTLTKSYYIGKYEITFEQYDAFCYDTNKNLPSDKNFGRGKHPAIYISWYDAIKFCNWLSKKENLTQCYKNINNKWECNFKSNGYRLPTEAEWEYAARGGNKSQGYEYSGSNNSDDVAWYIENSGRHTHPVGQKKPNELGIYDMSGNIYEWCWDGHIDNYYSKSQEIDPVARLFWQSVKRGGSYKGTVKSIRNTFRNSDYSNPDVGDEVGFRVVRILK